MALLAAAIPAGISAVGALGSYLYKRKKRAPAFKNTDYGIYLKRLSEEGIYSPEQRRIMLNQTGRQAGNVASIRRAKSRGQLVSRGLGGSVTGARLLDRPYREAQRGLAGTAERISMENEQSKRRAAERYAMGQTESRERRRVESRQDVGGLIQGLAGAGQQFAGNYLRGRQIESLGEYRKGLADAREARGKVSFPDDWENLGNRERIRWAAANGDVDLITKLLMLGEIE